MPAHLKPLYPYFVTSFVTPTGDVRDLRDPYALASPRQLWRLNQAGLLALVQTRPRSITMGRAAGAIDYLERERARRIARFEREARRIRIQLEEVRCDLQAWAALLAFEETGSWQEAARRVGFSDGSSARQSVEVRTDYRDEPGARLAKNREHRRGRLAWLEGADERRRAGVKAVPPC
jgi:hypothetical protein